MNDTTANPAGQLQPWTERDAFELACRQAKIYSQSTIVPDVYRENPSNCLIAMNMARRIGADIMQTMQSLHIIYGKPGWSAQFLIATFNQSGKFSSLRYEWKGEPGTPEHGCRAWAIEKATRERIEGPWVTMKLVKDEGWWDRKDSKGNFVSKWRTMPELMFCYRAAAYLVRTHAPELAMGLQTVDELTDTVIDITPEPEEREQPAPASSIDKAKEAIAATMEAQRKEAQQKLADVAERGLTDLAGSAVSFAAIAERIVKAKALDELDVAGDLIRTIPDEQQRAELDVEYRAARKRLQK